MIITVVTSNPRVGMTLTARSGLKLHQNLLVDLQINRRNDSYSPFGIETDIFIVINGTGKGCRNDSYSPFGIETLVATIKSALVT